MGKKVIVNEEQYQKLFRLIKEEMGIANEVLEISEKIKKTLYDGIDNGDSEGAFELEGIKIVWKMYYFPDFDVFEEWMTNNSSLYKNGFSYEGKILYLTVINVGDTFNFGEIEDTIHHEVEHYYQTLKKGRSNHSDTYQVIANNVYSKNNFISNLCWVFYYSWKFEIDAFINGGYSRVKTQRIGSFEEFLEKTGLISIKKRLEICRNFFKNKNYADVECIAMKRFIVNNNLFSFDDDKELRKIIITKIDDAYDYFLRKSARTYTLVENRMKEIGEFLLENRNLIKSNHIFGEI